MQHKSTNNSTAVREKKQIWADPNVLMVRHRLANLRGLRQLCESHPKWVRVGNCGWAWFGGWVGQNYGFWGGVYGVKETVLDSSTEESHGRIWASDVTFQFFLSHMGWRSYLAMELINLQILSIANGPRFHEILKFPDLCSRVWTQNG